MGNTVCRNFLFRNGLITAAAINLHIYRFIDQQIVGARRVNVDCDGFIRSHNALQQYYYCLSQRSLFCDQNRLFNLTRQTFYFRFGFSLRRVRANRRDIFAIR